MARSSRSRARTGGTASCASSPTARSRGSRRRSRRSRGWRRRRWRGHRRRRAARRHASSSAWTRRPGPCAASSPAPCATPPDPAVLPVARPIEFPTADGATARALYFAPTNPSFRGPDGELPPLIVESHGGPTGAASSSLSLDRAFFTSRGIAVVDVDYRGSYRLRAPVPRRAQGRVGDRRTSRTASPRPSTSSRAGLVDPTRLAIRGGSAGGYTTLAALTFRARGLRGGPQPLRHRGPRAHPPRRPQVRVALRRGPARPVGHRRGPADLPRPLADPLPRPGPRADAHLPGPRRPGRAALPGRRDGGGVRAAGHPVRRDALRGRGPRLPQGARPSGRSTRPRSRSSAASSGSRPPTTCPRSRSRASTRSGARRPSGDDRLTGPAHPRPAARP